MRDIGIWMADEIAKINTNSITAGFINNKKIDSNNNKLEVRDPEKQAKFPKKLTLKSPKKSGVKKKNYYNTKLTFSKDPKNPSVLAAAKLAGNNTVLSSNEELIADIISDLTELDNNGVKCVEEKEVEVEVVQGEGVDVGLTLSQDNEVVFEKEEGEEDDEEEEEEVEVDREKIVGYEMEDVKIFEVAEREVTPVADEETALATMPISVIGAIDMIKLSTFLST